MTENPATGPAPRPSVPWQEAQCVAKARPPTSTSIGFGSPGAGVSAPESDVAHASSGISRTSNRAGRDKVTPSWPRRAAPPRA